MGLPFVGAIRTGIKEFVLSILELRELKKLKRKTRCRVVYVTPDNILYTFMGKLSVNGDLLVIPVFDRLFWVNKIYRDEKFRPVVFVSEKYHRTLDLEMLNKMIKDSNNVESLDDVLEDENLIKNLSEDELAQLDSTINLNILDNPLSLDFSELSFKVVSTKAFEALEEPAKRMVMIVFAFGLLIGMVLATTLCFWMWVT